MNWKANYYGYRGRSGFVHAACANSFELAQARYDLQGRVAFRPCPDALLQDLGPAAAGNCLHCGQPLGGNQ